jgi:hypothetical protein
MRVNTPALTSRGMALLFLEATILFAAWDKTTKKRKLVGLLYLLLA